MARSHHLHFSYINQTFHLQRNKTKTTKIYLLQKERETHHKQIMSFKMPHPSPVPFLLYDSTTIKKKLGKGKGTLKTDLLTIILHHSTHGSIEMVLLLVLFKALATQAMVTVGSSEEGITCPLRSEYRCQLVHS